jgi:hypothetical protein
MLSLSDEGTTAPGAMLKSLKGIGPEFAGVLWSEGLFRSFSNRRQVASYCLTHNQASWIMVSRDISSRICGQSRLNFSKLVINYNISDLLGGFTSANPQGFATGFCRPRKLPVGVPF